MITVKWKNSFDEISADFWTACFPPPLEGSWWYQAVEETDWGSQYKFLYALVLDGNEPVAIAPAFVMNVPMEMVIPPWANSSLQALGRIFPRVLFQRTLFIGSPFSDEGSVGLAPGVEFEHVASAIQVAAEQKAKQEGTEMIVWKDFHYEFHECMTKISKEFGMFPSISYPSTIVDLSEPTFEYYFNNMKGSRRHNLKKKLKRSKDQVKLVSHVVQYPDENTRKEIWGLFRQTYEKGGPKFDSLTPKNPEFFRALGSKNASWWILVREEATGDLVGFMLCFRVGKRIINKFIGLDYRRPPDWFLYFRLWESALAWVLTTGATEFQSGQTGYRAKIDVGHSFVPLVNYARNRNPILHEIYRRIGPRITWSDLDPQLAEFVKAHPQEEWQLPSPSGAQDKSRVMAQLAAVSGKS